LLAWNDIAQHLEHIRVIACQEERKRGKKEVVEKPIVIVNYMEKMGRMDTADQYMATYCFLRRTLKWELKVFFWGYGGFSNRCIHPVWKVARKTTAFQ